MRCALGLAGLLIAGCAAAPREEPPPAAQAADPPPVLLPVPAFVPSYSVSVVPEHARAPSAAPTVAATQPAKVTVFEDSPALPKPEAGTLSTTGYRPLEGEKPLFEKLPRTLLPGSVASIDAKPGDAVSWLGIVRGIESDAERGRTRLLVEAKYFDGLTDSHILCVDFNSPGDFVATLDGAYHPVKPLALVRVYGSVTAVKDGVPRVHADYVRHWDWGRFTFMMMRGEQKGNPEWRKVVDPRVDAESVYAPFPGPDYYRATLGPRDDFAPGRVAVPAD